jgi:two-component system cell cycle sensor histidine kinase PleC
MPVDGPRASLPPTGAGPEKALAGCVDPAWIIDPAKGRVLAANAAGAARLGLRPDAASGTLDAAMPGLVRLRAMVREPLNGGRREPLIFWTAYGAESLLCDVAAVPEGAALSSELVLVSIASGQAKRAKASIAAPVPVETAPAALPPAVTPSGEDAATMTKIARAIRSGFAGGRRETAPAISDADADEPEAAQGDRAVQVSKLAHELRTPLSAIAAAAEIMKDQRFGAIGNERYRGYTSDIHDNAHHALALINRLLGGDAALEPGNAPQTAELDLNALAESSVSAMRPLAEEAGLKLAHEFHGALPHVTADATMVKQILFNLLSNAVKFTPRGGDVRVVTGLGYDRSVFVAVQDSGTGMTAEAIATALKSKVPDNPQRKEAGGHGIGLPLARDLAQTNGARLEIDSAPNEGTAVALIFPRDRVVARKEPSPSTAV